MTKFLKTARALMIASAATTGVVASQADAATYVFNVVYSGSAPATLLPGSANPTTVNLQVGDSFTYNLFAAGAGYWQGASTSFFAAMPMTTGGIRQSTYSYSFLNDGAVVASGDMGTISSAYVHVGTYVNTPSVRFDQITFGGKLLASDAAVNTASSLLPFSGAPNVAFTAAAAVPEPGTWALMLLGFGAVGYATRRRKIAFATRQMA